MTETKVITPESIIEFCNRQGLELPSFTIIEEIAGNGEKIQTNPLTDIFDRLIAIHLLNEEIEELCEEENLRRYREEILPLFNKLQQDYPILIVSSLGKARESDKNLSTMLKYVRQAMKEAKK